MLGRLLFGASQEVVRNKQSYLSEVLGCRRILRGIRRCSRLARSQDGQGLTGSAQGLKRFPIPGTRVADINLCRILLALDKCASIENKVRPGPE